MIKCFEGEGWMVFLFLLNAKEEVEV